MESAMSSLLDLNLPRDLWAEAVNTSVYINNRIHGKTTKTPPFEFWYGRKPDVSYFRIFGSFAYVYIPKSLRQKLDPKSHKLLFVGYSETQKAYRFFDRSTRRITVSRDAIFCESPVAIQAIPATSKQSETELIRNIDSPIEKEITDLPTESPATIDPIPDSLSPRDVVTNFDGFEPPLRRSNRIRKPKFIQSFITQLDTLAFPDPDNLFYYDDAIASSNAKEWTFAMQTEIDAWNRLKTWT